MIGRGNLWTFYLIDGFKALSDASTKLRDVKYCSPGMTSFWIVTLILTFCRVARQLKAIAGRFVNAYELWPMVTHCTVHAIFRQLTSWPPAPAVHFA